MKVFTISVALALAASAVSALNLTIRNDLPGNSTSPLQYGIMYEDINRCGDSGIYNQMLRNWNFQASDDGSTPTTEFWSTVGDGASINLDTEAPFNEVNKNSLRLDISSSASDRAGIANEGWWGIRVQPGEKYQASFYAKSSNYSGLLNVTLESSSGEVLASTSVKGLSDEFQKFEVTLSPSVSETSIDNKFVVSVDGASAQGASIYFQLFTLFGETYKNRENGLRKDLAEALEGMNPSFFRFPGGNNLEGQTIPTRWKWNETVGPLEQRIGRMGDWSYWNTNGQGLLDYMYMCEDLGMEPILDVYAGYSLEGDSVPEDQLELYIQEVLNELEYLMGDTSTTYGKLRAEHGREEPFDIRYIEIGNEDFFSTTYNYRYKAYYDAIVTKYPNLKFIQTTSQDERPWDLIDDHYYNNVPDMIADFDHYDNWPRNGTGVFVGEFGTNVKGCCGSSPANMQAALADAVFMTGLERNADLVKMIAYAPTLKRDGHEQWNPDMIHFDTESVWLTPSYYAFQMWSKNRADTIIQVDATDGGFDPLYWVVGSKKDTKQIFVKMVNTGNSSETVNFQLKNASLHSEGVAQILAGDLDAENTKDTTVVKTVEKTFKLDSKSSFQYTFEPNSATVLLLHEM